MTRKQQSKSQTTFTRKTKNKFAWGTDPRLANRLRLPYGIVPIGKPKEHQKIRLVTKLDDYRRLGFYLRTGHNKYNQLFYLLDFKLYPVNDNVFLAHTPEYQQILCFFKEAENPDHILDRLGFNATNCPWSNICWTSEQLEQQKRYEQHAINVLQLSKRKRLGKKERKKRIIRLYE